VRVSSLAGLHVLLRGILCWLTSARYSVRRRQHRPPLIFSWSVRAGMFLLLPNYEEFFEGIGASSSCSKEKPFSFLPDDLQVIPGFPHCGRTSRKKLQEGKDSSTLTMRHSVVPSVPSPPQKRCDYPTSGLQQFSLRRFSPSFPQITIVPSPPTMVRDDPHIGPPFPVVGPFSEQKGNPLSPPATGIFPRQNPPRSSPDDPPSP